MFRWFHKWTTHNLWLKLVALFLAVISWFYINEKVTGIYTGRFPQFLTVLTEGNPVISKTVSVKLNFTGSPARGYSVDNANIKLTPSECVIWGRKSVLSDIENIYTLPVDISRQSEKIIVQVKLEKIKDVILPDNFFVTAEVPFVLSK